jgi:hypothetical protein
LKANKEDVENILDKELKDLKEETSSTTEKGINKIQTIDSNKVAKKAETI